MVVLKCVGPKLKRPKSRSCDIRALRLNLSRGHLEDGREIIDCDAFDSSFKCRASTRLVHKRGVIALIGACDHEEWQQTNSADS